MFRRCLICTDFSDGLNRLVHFVPSLAAGGLQQIVFLHCVPFGQEGGIPRVDQAKVDQARDRLSVALEHVPDGVDVKIEVQSGQPVERILAVAKTYQSDLIVVGMPARSLLSEKLFGSNTIELTQKTPIPLLNLRPAMTSAYTTEELDLRCQHLFRYLLIPYDGSDEADYLVEQVKQYAQQRPPQSLACCLVCWVIETGGPLDELTYPEKLQTAQAKLAAVKADLETLGLQVETSLRQGNAVVETLDAAVEIDISAIAVSSDHCGKFWELSVPSFGGEILRRSWHPVLFFPPIRS